MTFTDTEAKVPLQSALDWQVGKLINLDSKASTRDQLTALSNDGYDIEFLIKWGADGFTDNSEYKDASDGKQGAVFATVLVPVRMTATKKSANIFNIGISEYL